MPENGTHRLGTIGGSPDGLFKLPEVEALQRMQIGYQVKPRLGLIKILGLSPDDVRIFECEVDVGGYNSRTINSCKAPGSIFVELPCSVVVRGPVGVTVMVEAWEVDAVGTERGAVQTILAESTATQVPIWAGSFDLGSSGIATFRDASSAVVGVVSGPLVGFTVPSRAASVDVAGDDNTPLIFRQQG